MNSIMHLSKVKPSVSYLQGPSWPVCCLAFQGVWGEEGSISRVCWTSSAAFMAFLLLLLLLFSPLASAPLSELFGILLLSPLQTWMVVYDDLPQMDNTPLVSFRTRHLACCSLPTGIHLYLLFHHWLAVRTCPFSIIRLRSNSGHIYRVKGDCTESPLPAH